MTKQIQVASLERSIRENLFNLHATYENPEATEADFYRKWVKLVKIDLSAIADANLVKGMTEEQSKRYLQYVGPAHYPAVAQGKLIDGMHRLTAMKKAGRKECVAADFSGLVDTAKSGFQIPLKLKPIKVAHLSM
ncbi:TPA: hypothetical protein QDB06_000822 [Burkholderia vietnamiensis]|nr:hypothetical protein [Burkholderia vietnamiensis]